MSQPFRLQDVINDVLNEVLTNVKVGGLAEVPKTDELPGGKPRQPR